MSASSVMFATTGTYPTSFAAMTVGASPALKTGQGTTIAGNTVYGKGWKLTITGGGATAPTFHCASTPLG